MTTVAISRRGRAESDRLTRALLEAASRGLRPHCSDPVTSEMWLSEHKPDRAEACKLCRGCPVLLECRDVGKYQTWECGAAGTSASHQAERSSTTKQPNRDAIEQGFAFLNNSHSDDQPSQVELTELTDLSELTELTEPTDKGVGS
jgi:hypothetical protein